MQVNRNIDIRSLRFFISLYRNGSLQKTGGDFGMSAATAQRTLAKLRACFGDQLFERQGFEMTPTAEARRLAGELSVIVQAFDHLGENSEAFEKKPYLVRLTAFDNAAIAAVVRIFDRVQTKAPNLRIQILQADERMFDELRTGTTDFALYARQGLPVDCMSAPLVETEYAWVVRKGHPLEKEASERGFVERARAVRYPQVVANAQPDRRRVPNGPAEGWFAEGAEEALVSMPFFLVAPYFVEHSDAVTLIPRKTAEAVIDRSRFSILPTEPGSPHLLIRMAWHRNRDQEPFHQWLRAVFIAAAHDAER